MSSSIMNSLRVPWTQYTLPFSFALIPHGVMGSKPITSPTYIQLTMANHENFKLISALENAPQKIHPPHFSGFDKETPLTSTLKTSLITHLSTPSPLVPVFLTPTPTPPSTSVSSSIVTTLEP